MKKYNLTFFQWIIEVPILWIMYYTCSNAKRKESFHLVLKCSEKHKHTYTIPYFEIGLPRYYYKCSHEGCNMVSPDFEP